MIAERDRHILRMLEALGAPNGSDLFARTDRLLRELGVWEVAHRLRPLLVERPADSKEFLEYLAKKHPAAADRIQMLLTATKGEDKELVKREFGGD